MDELRNYYTEWSESERERNICTYTHSNTHIWNLEIWYWRIYLQGSNWKIDIENRLMDMGRGEERVGCMEESNMETYITICKIDSQWKFAVWLRKLKNGLCINLEGWDGEGDWRIYLWLIHVEVWQKTTKFCKAIILQ